jgi:hypothetical protein
MTDPRQKEPVVRKETKAEKQRREREVMKKVRGQIDFYEKREYADQIHDPAYERMTRLKTTQMEREFIEKYKSRPNERGQLKRPDEHESDNEAKAEEAEVADDPAKRQKTILKLLGSSFLPEAAKEHESYADR